MMTIFLEVPATALVSASRVVTVVCVPPEPPVVLRINVNDDERKFASSNAPAVKGSIADCCHVVD
jgi:hypothetical protein